MIPSEDQIDNTLSLRHTAKVNEKLRSVKVGIAGLGGLGSNIAAMLVRSGIRDLVIADHDKVDISNINRQNYFIEQLGSDKTDATEENLKRINPYVKIKKHTIRIDPNNITNIFEKCEIVCEAFDQASEKSMFINNILEKCPDTTIVSGSGMAGFGRSNEIITKHMFDRLYMCGDGIDMEDVEAGLMSPRVNICAGHMANTVISILMKGEL